jgi:all-trans-8'-apo-beta-carotenal 15,15'-oxygenase
VAIRAHHGAKQGSIDMPATTHNLFWGFGEGTHNLEVVEGTWPADIDGWVFIVGPDKRRPGGHWFNEHGLLCRIDCQPDSNGRIRVQHRLVDTPVKRLRDRAPGLFRKWGVLETSPFGSSNLANTSVEAINGRLFVGYDVGRQVEIDPQTLDFITPVGANDEWNSITPGLLEPMVSIAAHPAVDEEDGALYFVNYRQVPLPGLKHGSWVARWDLDGPVRMWQLEGMSPYDSIHDIKSTRDFLVISDLPFVVEPGSFSGKPRTRAPADCAQLWFVRKNDLATAAPGNPVRVVEVKIPIAVGHIVADYENHGDVVTLYLQHNWADLMASLGPNERSHATGTMTDPNYDGFVPMGLQPSTFSRIRVNARTGELLDRRLAVEPEHCWGGILYAHNRELPSSRAHTRNVFYAGAGWDPDLVPETLWRLGRHTTHAVVPMDRLPDRYLPGTLARIDAESMKFVDVATFGDGVIPHPPTFVPRTNAKHDSDGYVLVVVHKDAPKQLQLFDAQNLSKGPIACATAADFNPPLLLHSCYMPRRIGPRPSSYRVDLARDLWGGLRSFGGLPPLLGGVAKTALKQSRRRRRGGRPGLAR